MNYAAIIAADMRLVLLRALCEDADYSHNEYVLKSILEQLGHRTSSDRLRTELAWLTEQGLIITDDRAGVVVARLTPRGKDVACGACVIPGVKRPEPL
ncbi:MAG: ArsR family transcriptional regulator [Thermodesulfobacteriota bacterium]